MLLKPQREIISDSKSSESISKDQIVLIASCDIDEINKMFLPVEVYFADNFGRIYKSETPSKPLSLEEVRTRLVGCISASKEGHEILTAARRAWEKDFTDFSLSITSQPVQNRADALEWLVIQILKYRKDAAVRTSRLMRELGVMRRQHDETQASFRALESYFYQHAKSSRSPDLILSPVARQRPLTLTGGSRLEQRLPGSSVGLSDIALHIPAARPARGLLHVNLTSPDTGEMLAAWEVDAATLPVGWLRLSTERALDSQSVTLVLTVSYEGPDRVQLSNSVHHPETRFQPRHDDMTVPVVPALQIWRWIAGVEVPLAANAILPIGTRDGLRRVHAQALTTARDLNDPNVEIGLQADTEALLVHALEDRMAGAVLSSIALTGARHLYADIRTYHHNASEVEYRIALAPAGVRSPGVLPDFATDMASDWVRMSPMEDGQVHLFLPKPLDRPCDIYLLTRLPEQGRSNNYAWSTFANLSLQY